MRREGMKNSKKEDGKEHQARSCATQKATRHERRIRPLPNYFTDWTERERAWHGVVACQQSYMTSVLRRDSRRSPKAMNRTPASSSGQDLSGSPSRIKNKKEEEALVGKKIRLFATGIELGYRIVSRFNHADIFVDYWTAIRGIGGEKKN